MKDKPHTEQLCRFVDKRGRLRGYAGKYHRRLKRDAHRRERRRARANPECPPLHKRWNGYED